VEAAKALGGSFKLVTLAPKPAVREMTHCSGKHKHRRMGTYKQIKKAQMNTQHEISVPLVQ